ncbi:hypothetical protein [Sporosarcina sp. YIM B06819]|uniref:hypothetical protein n=1 Tax=Sporosarcina sp. YIM B06819 TaxID=3081769 RepID=UPI00298BDFDC|nr:hypothetical protein [Sporosarcina sp. YIM B06819]
MFRLPFLFIITGMISFLLFHGASIFALFDWLQQDLRGPSGWFYTHVFVLGWATMLAMGAVYQLINVILQSTIYSKRLGYAHYACFTVGLSGLLYGFVTMKTMYIAAFATFAFIGILLFAVNIGVTLWRANKWDAITISAACAVLYLVLTGLMGMWMGVNFYTGNRAQLHEHLLRAHIWLGTIGWFGMLITGFSYKMLPMFYLAHHYPTKLQWATLITWNSAVMFGAISFLLGGGFWLTWLALLLVMIALIFYTIHLLRIKKYRIKLNPGYGILWSVYAAQFLLLFVGGMLLFTLVFPAQLLHPQFVLLAGWVYLGGWVSFTILCYMSKIIPFLWWTHKYGKLAGRPGTPLMADLLDDKKVRMGVIVIALCLFVLFTAIVIDSKSFIAMAALILSISSVLYMILIGRVFRQ